MKQYRLSKRAENDLLNIFIYGIERFGLIQAEKYNSELDNCFGLISQNPQMGRSTNKIIKSLRRHEHKSHVIFYEEHNFGILILTIIHEKSIQKLDL